MGANLQIGITAIAGERNVKNPPRARGHLAGGAVQLERAVPNPEPQ